MGAGISQDLIDKGANHGLAKADADINVEARGALIMRARANGDYNSPYAMVGHGGNARDWRNVSRRDTGRDYSLNFSSASRFGTSIGRLAEVMGDINIRTGLVENPITNVLEPTSAAGVVLVQGYQTSSNSRFNNGFAQIGHMGLAQAGSATGDINVLAGGAIGVEGGAGWRGNAAIGHILSGGDADSDPRTGMGALAVTGLTPDGKFGGGQHHQFRAFRDDTDFNNTTLRTGTLVGTMIPVTGGGAGIYNGTTSVTGAGADVFSNLEGDIKVVSTTGGVTVKNANLIADQEKQDYTFSKIGHGGMSVDLQRLNIDGDITVRAGDWC